MSASSKINDSPGHFMVLQAIAGGFDTIDKIAVATRKSEEEVRDIINDLVNQRLANMKEKGRFYFRFGIRIFVHQTRVFTNWRFDFV